VWRGPRRSNPAPRRRRVPSQFPGTWPSAYRPLRRAITNPIELDRACPGAPTRAADRKPGTGGGAGGESHFATRTRWTRRTVRRCPRVTRFIRRSSTSPGSASGTPGGGRTGSGSPPRKLT
jgi:hypothetical protein